MRSSGIARVALAFLPFSVFLGGCPVWLGENETPGTPLECRDHDDCEPGERCDRGTCVVPPECNHDDDCLASERCDDGACVPRPACSDDDDCAAGETCMPGGFCAPSVPCDDHGDCPSGMWCGGDGVCEVPLPGACRDAGDCDAGELCVQDFCRDSAEVCQFNASCGLTAALDPRACVDNGCGGVCDEDADCASSGTTCASGFCVPDRTECATHADCDEGSECFLGRCLPSCEGDAVCTRAEDECGPDGLCRPTWAPRPLCDGPEDCGAGSDCVEGVCRVPCPEAPLVCLNIDVQLTSCDTDTGYCQTENERAPECFTGTECDADESCVDAECRSL